MSTAHVDHVVLIAIEGVHDAAVIQQMLKAEEFSQEKRSDGLPECLQRLVPTSYPANPKKDMTIRVDIPYFHFRNQQWVILVVANGDSQIVQRLSTTLLRLADAPRSLPSALGILIDSDERPPTERFRLLQLAWQEEAKENNLLETYAFPEVLGVNSANCHVFIMPDNQNTGRLESILLERGQQVYPLLHEKAKSFIRALELTPSAIPDEGKHTEVKLNSTTGRFTNEEKAILHSMYGVFRPCKTLQASIAINKWIPESPHEVEACAPLKPMFDFLTSVLKTL